MLEAAGAIMGGQARRQEAKAQAQQAEQQARDVDLAAKQTSEERRAALRASLSTIEATRSAAGLSLDSPTAMAIEREVKRQSVRGEQVGSLGSKQQSKALMLQGEALRRAGKNAALLGAVQAGVVASATAAKAASGGGG